MACEWGTRLGQASQGGQTEAEQRQYKDPYELAMEILDRPLGSFGY